MSPFQFLLLLLQVVSGTSDPIRPYPIPKLPSTSFLDHISYIRHFHDDHQWYLDSIPFVDFPDKTIQEVYYYRASLMKRHLKFSHEGHRWMFTSFIQPVGQGGKFQTLPGAVPHTILETRWFRDPNFSKDEILLYTRQGAESMTGVLYTHWIIRAIYEHAQVTGDEAFLIAQLPGMIHMFDLWTGQQDNHTGLYFRSPVLDSQEYSLTGYLTAGPDGVPIETWNSLENDYQLLLDGPPTYRPNFNAYMVAGARVISSVAAMTGDMDAADEWNVIANAIYSRMLEYLYDADLNYWVDVVRETEMVVKGRQLQGFFPFRMGVGTDDHFIRGLEESLTEEGFIAPFGPTTLEQENRYFTAKKNITYCCIWNGQNWPFSTSHYLNTLAQIARENRSPIISADFFYDALSTYAKTNYKDGVPYTAESHHPYDASWSADTSNHSEHYLHSTFIDNVFSNLVGIVPTLDDRLEIKPLVPHTWTHFAVESLPYHGFLLTIIWDETGRHYNTNLQGLAVYLNGEKIYNQPSLAPCNISLPNKTRSVKALANFPRFDNILANPNSPLGLPKVESDYLFDDYGSRTSQAWKLNDGLLWYDTVPDNRWTTNQSFTPTNKLTVTLPRPRTFSSISLAVFDD
ncbi:Six-hairpin glycosidase, partial [Aulographum hederae CBS 113979]